jgi:hypothetical protein
MRTRSVSLVKFHRGSDQMLRLRPEFQLKRTHRSFFCNPAVLNFFFIVLHLSSSMQKMASTVVRSSLCNYCKRKTGQSVCLPTPRLSHFLSCHCTRERSFPRMKAENSSCRKHMISCECSTLFTKISSGCHSKKCRKLISASLQYSILSRNYHSKMCTLF